MVPPGMTPTPPIFGGCLPPLAKLTRAATGRQRIVRAPAGTRAPHPCAAPDCPTILPAGAPGRCAKHGGTTRTGKPRPTGSRWQRLRAQALSRDGKRCRRCGASDRLEAHHLVPVSEGGSDKLSNVVTLCRACHLDLHRRGAGYPLSASGVSNAKGAASPCVRFDKDAER